MCVVGEGGGGGGVDPKVRSLIRVYICGEKGGYGCMYGTVFKPARVPW